MRVIKQLSEDEFVVKMDESDLTPESKMLVAHDYVQFGANMGIMLDTKADWRPTGKFAGAAANWIKGYFQVQIGIRTFIKVVLSQLLSNEYCQKEHLVDKEGHLCYNWETRPLILTTNDGTKVVALKANNGEYTLLPYESYTQIKDLVAHNL